MPRRSRPALPPMDTRKLTLLILFLCLAIAVTIGTVWYNLRRAGGGNTADPLLRTIVNKLQEPVNASTQP